MFDTLPRTSDTVSMVSVALGRAPTIDDSFPNQWVYVTSRALFNAVCCSRRAGKSVGAILRALYLMATKPGAHVHYVSLIRRNARKHFWKPLLKLLSRLGWQYKANESDMILELPNGSWCQALSCPDLAHIKMVKGDWSDLFMVDECQEPNNDLLETLIDVAAVPMLTDTGGMLDLLGTPPDVEPCFFSEALDSDGWAHFHWTQFDHDYPSSREAKWARVKSMCEKRGLSLVDVHEAANDNGQLVLEPGPGTPLLVLREYFGRRVRDQSKLAYEYLKGRNDYDPRAVDIEEHEYRHSGGLDLGSCDADAIVVHGWGKRDQLRRLFVRWQWQHNELDVDDLADILGLVQERFRIGTWCGDHGGHGAMKVLATVGKRLRKVIYPKPPDVMFSVRLMNDDYRTSRLLHPTIDIETPKLLAILKKRPWYATERGQRIERILLAGAKGLPLTAEIGRVGRSVNQTTRKLEINRKGFHSDVSEANRYSHHAARHWAPKTIEEEPDHDQERIERCRNLERQRQDPYAL